MPSLFVESAEVSKAPNSVHLKEMPHKPTKP